VKRELAAFGAHLDTTTMPLVRFRWFDSLSPRRRSGERVRERGFQFSAIRWKVPLSPAFSPLVPRKERGAGGFHDGVVSKMALALAFWQAPVPNHGSRSGASSNNKLRFPSPGLTATLSPSDGEGQGSSEILQTGLDSVVVQRCALRALSFTLTTDYPLDTLAPWQNLL